MLAKTRSCSSRSSLHASVFSHALTRCFESTRHTVNQFLGQFDHRSKESTLTVGLESLPEMTIVRAKKGTQHWMIPRPSKHQNHSAIHANVIRYQEGTSALKVLVIDAEARLRIACAVKVMLKHLRLAFCQEKCAKDENGVKNRRTYLDVEL